MSGRIGNRFCALRLDCRRDTQLDYDYDHDYDYVKDPEEDCWRVSTITPTRIALRRSFIERAVMDPPANKALEPAATECARRRAAADGAAQREVLVAAAQRQPLLRHDVAYRSCLPLERRGLMRRPPVPPGEPTGLNKERPGQKYGSPYVRAGSKSRDALPPGSHNPGDGQAVSMVNTCEPVIKIVMANEPKWLLHWAQAKMAKWVGAGLNGAVSWMKNPPVDSRYLTSHMLHERNVETPYASCRRFGFGGWVRREARRSVCRFGMSEEAKAVL